MFDLNKNDKSDLKELKQRIFEVIQIGTRVDFYSTIFDVFISLAIILNILVTFLHTFDSLSEYTSLFASIERVTTFIFIIEYILRLFTSDLLYPDTKSPKCMIRFVRSFYGMVDLLTIISYFSSLFSNGFIVLKMIRVVRICRLFRINTNSDAFSVVGEVIYEKKNQIVSSLFMIAVLLLASSFIMYGLEHDAQPEAFDNAFAGIWWAMSTVLTVGYGDIYPITTGGRLMAIIIAIYGVGVVAIPTGIISAGFVEYYTKLNNSSSAVNFRNDVRNILERQAMKAGLSKEDYLEKLILEKELEDMQNKK